MSFYGRVGKEGILMASARASELRSVQWRKSTRSGSGGGQCVEVGLGSSMAGVRDSKDQDGPALWFGPRVWAGFLGTVKDGRFG